MRGIPNTDLATVLLTNREINGACWLWTMSKTPLGYGKVSHQGRDLLVHRVSAQVYLGLAPNDPRLALHTCQHKHCFNPEHLYVGTQRENVLDSVYAKTHGKTRNAHCSHGHPFVPNNTAWYTHKNGHVSRWCRACKQNTNRRRRKQ